MTTEQVSVFDYSTAEIIYDNYKQNVFLHGQGDKNSLKRVPELRDFLYGDLTSIFLRTKVCLEITPTVSHRDLQIKHKITKKYH